MWLPMWVFDGNGFTMACLAVWIRNVALRWGLPQWRGGQERWMRWHPTAPVNVARISVATSGTDFTAPEADVRSASLNGRQPLCNGREEALDFFPQIRDRLAIAREMPQQASLEESIKQRIEGAPGNDR